MAQIGRYELSEVVERGESATVHRAHDVETGQPVLAIVLDGSARGRERVFDMPRLFAGLEHPNIVPVLDLVGEGKSLAIITASPAGVGLDRLIARARGPLPYGLSRRVLPHVMDAVSFAHTRGLVHGALAPERVFVRSAGEDDVGVEVFDFARAALARVRPSWRRRMRSALPYAPPEVRRGTAVDRSTDTYGLGALLFAMTAGHAPGRRPWRDPALPEPLRDLVRRALSANPHERFGTVREFADAFADADRTLRESEPESAPMPARRTRRPDAMLIPLSAAAILLIAALALYLTRPAEPVERRPAVVAAIPERPVPAAPNETPAPAPAPEAAPNPTPAPPPASTPTPAPAVAAAPTPSSSPPPTPPTAPARSPTPEPRALASVPVLGRHLVRAGESLYCIGRGYGVDPRVLAQANGLAANAGIETGASLVIPDAPWQHPLPGRACAPQFAMRPHGAAPPTATAAAVPPAPEEPARTPPSGTGQPAPAPPPPEEPFEEDLLGVEPPLLEDRTPAVYPDEARRARAEGDVVLMLAIDETGQVDDARVVCSRPLLDAAAIDAVLQWKYRPGRRDGHAIRLRWPVVVPFRLGE